VRGDDVGVVVLPESIGATGVTDLSAFGLAGFGVLAGRKRVERTV
jgi:hypothetical protein